MTDLPRLRDEEALHARLVTQAQIARHFGVDVTTVRLYARERPLNGFPPPIATLTRPRKGTLLYEWEPVVAWVREHRPHWFRAAGVRRYGRAS